MSVEPPADPRARLRASDSDRELVVDQLRTYLAEGRLTVEEFEDRSSRTYQSKTYGELWEVTHDLPAPRARSGPPVRQPDGQHPEHRPRGKTDNVAATAVTFGVINGFLVAIWALSGFGYFWPIWVILPCALVLGLHVAGSIGHRGGGHKHH
jgi:uncharacterized protein DUF1707